MPASAAVSDDRRVAIEGWRSLPHSYAIVNQWQILSFLRKGYAVDFHDLPFQGTRAPEFRGIFSSEDEKILRGLYDTRPDVSYDLCYRICYPLSLRSRSSTGGKAKRVMVFGTAEHQLLADGYLAYKPDIEELNSDENFFAISPSVWSSAGFLKLGLSPSRVKVVPHGVDTLTFNNDRTRRDEIRNQLGLRGFAFLNCGAMTRNKGVDLLLRAFRNLLEGYPDAQLVLKGTDRLFDSKNLVFSYLRELDHHGQGKVAERIVYIGHELSMAAMSDIYRAADVYVSPYRAEGFNLPVLEAAACGTPILCTGGGPTDDFVTDAFSKKITAIFNESANGNWLEPNLDHLVALMEEAIQAHEFRAAALIEGPSYVSPAYSWDRIVDRLISL